MGRIVSHVKIKNLFEQDAVITCDALVDTGAAFMVLPKAWKERLGKIHTVREVDGETATQDIVKGEVCGPVEIKIEGFEQVKTNKLSPTLFERMGIEFENDQLRVPVVKEIPGYLMGSGIGFTPTTESVDYDIQTTCPEVVEEFDLKKLRLGDIVAIRDQACIYGRGHYRGALTIGVIIHGWSDIGGHGPGVNPLLSSLDGELQPIIDPDANMALYLGLRESL